MNVMMQSTEPGSAAPSSEPQTMPLLSSAPLADEPTLETLPADVEPQLQTSLLGRTSLLLLIVAVVIGSTLTAMRGTQGDMIGSEAAKAVEEKVEQALARLAGADVADEVAADLLPPAPDNTKQIVAMFEGDPSQGQVPLAFLKKNPFVTQSTAPPPPPAPKASATAPTQVSTIDRRTQRIATLKREVMAMQVQTIIQGSSPMAIINGQIVKPGQRLGSFTVGSIDSREVRLVAGDVQIAIRMEQ